MLTDHQPHSLNQHFPTFLVYVPSYPMMHPMAQALWVLWSGLCRLLNEHFFLPYTHVFIGNSSVYAPSQAAPGLPTAQLLGIVSSNTDSAHSLATHSLQPLLRRRDRSSFASYCVYHTFLKGSGHPFSKHFMTYS